MSKHEQFAKDVCSELKTWRAGNDSGVGALESIERLIEGYGVGLDPEPADMRYFTAFTSGPGGGGSLTFECPVFPSYDAIMSELHKGVYITSLREFKNRLDCLNFEEKVAK